MPGVPDILPVGMQNILYRRESTLPPLAGKVKQFNPNKVFLEQLFRGNRSFKVFLKNALIAGRGPVRDH